jgi:hypothetical protein
MMRRRPRIQKPYVGNAPGLAVTSMHLSGYADRKAGAPPLVSRRQDSHRRPSQSTSMNRFPPSGLLGRRRLRRLDPSHPSFLPA